MDATRPVWGLFFIVQGLFVTPTTPTSTVFPLKSPFTDAYIRVYGLFPTVSGLSKFEIYLQYILFGDEPCLGFVSNPHSGIRVWGLSTRPRPFRGILPQRTPARRSLPVA